MKSKRFRKNIRLPDYDYSQPGAYFVTIVTQDRRALFGHVAGGEMMLNDAGRMVDQVCKEMPDFIEGIRLDNYQIMPDHIHMIIEIGLSENGSVAAGANDDVAADLRVCPGQPQRVAPADDTTDETDETDDTMDNPSEKRITLPNVVARCKSLTTRRYIDGVYQSNWPRFDKRLWQRNYYERIIRNEGEYKRVVDYIQANPLNWGR